MARRAGKAASRKARQRYQPRTPRPAPTPAPETAAPTDVVDASPVRTDEPARRPGPVAYATAGSSLSSRERAEYHYVERDLRNIGILTLVMLIVLVAAWFVFNGLGLVG